MDIDDIGKKFDKLDKIRCVYAYLRKVHMYAECSVCLIRLLAIALVRSSRTISTLSQCLIFRSISCNVVHIPGNLPRKSPPALLLDNIRRKKHFPAVAHCCGCTFRFFKYIHHFFSDTVHILLGHHMYVYPARAPATRGTKEENVAEHDVGVTVIS